MNVFRHRIREQIFLHRTSSHSRENSRLRLDLHLPLKHLEVVTASVTVSARENFANSSSHLRATDRDLSLEITLDRHLRLRVKAWLKSNRHTKKRKEREAFRARLRPVQILPQLRCLGCIGIT